jgi:hypothetical protein
MYIQIAPRKQNSHGGLVYELCWSRLCCLLCETDESLRLIIQGEEFTNKYELKLDEF